MITPIEMYTMVPKSQEASHVRTQEMAKDAAKMAEITQSIEHQANENTQRTVKMSEATNPEYRYDAKEKGNGEYSSDGGRKKGEGDHEDEEKHEKPHNMTDHPGGIDIRI